MITKHTQKHWLMAFPLWSRIKILFGRPLQLDREIDHCITPAHSGCGGYLAYHGPTTERSEDRPETATTKDNGK